MHLRFAHLLLAACLVQSPSLVLAATIHWSPLKTVASVGDVFNPGSNGELVFAFDLTGGNSTPPRDDGIINAVPFVQLKSFGDKVQVMDVFGTSIIPGFQPYASSFWRTPTGDVDLDSLLDSHWWQHTEQQPGPASYELKGLNVGKRYSVQLLAIADVRSCCSARTYEPDNGEGQYNTGLQLVRGQAHTIRGVFTADATSQTFLMRSLNNDEVNHIDPGLSGIVLFELIPEPGTTMLAVLGSLVLVVGKRR